MATVKSRFDASVTVSTQHESDGPWLTTYSRALCSIYPKDEDACWDYLLSTQPSSIFSKESEDNLSIPPATITPNRINHSGPTTKHAVLSPTTAPSPPSLPYTSSSVEQPTPSDSSNNFNQDSEITIALTSPGKLSHALCKIGFDCIDYFTATQDDLVSEPPQPSMSRNSNNNNNNNCNTYTSPLLNELSDSDWRSGLAAAVGGKRAAALERKRALSRTMSQEEVTATDSDTATPGQWFQTLDRLSRWDSYR